MNESNKKKIFPPKDSHVFSKLMKYREEAESLAHTIQGYLKTKGYLK